MESNLFVPLDFEFLLGALVHSFLLLNRCRELARAHFIACLCVYVCVRECICVCIRTVSVIRRYILIYDMLLAKCFWALWCKYSTHTVLRLYPMSHSDTYRTHAIYHHTIKSWTKCWHSFKSSGNGIRIGWSKRKKKKKPPLNRSSYCAYFEHRFTRNARAHYLTR